MTRPYTVDDTNDTRHIAAPSTMPAANPYREQPRGPQPDTGQPDTGRSDYGQSDSDRYDAEQTRVGGSYGNPAAGSQAYSSQPFGSQYPAPSGYPTHQNEPGGYLPYPDAGRDQMEYGRPWQQPPQPGGPGAAGVEPAGARTLWILAFVFSAVALLVPFVGFAAIACGAVSWNKGSRRGKLATFVAIGATIVGWVIGALLVLS
ncbi:DUF4190 domain-containing protein [Candidatus Frankia nodulisporulans]|uniref:DUF4190 domain-containing protein n=1 Tax=Candidatus Frankia nodulisporulans TaxID=2060052 RepID=UPI00158398CC|nr:DUF4190 domain-containing protein [Candidatus Frankia nodulisporulans]